MVSIHYTKMEILDKGNTVRFIGECSGEKVVAEMSVLTVALLLGTDKEIIENIDFGTRELEQKCNETREKIKEFPDVESQGRITSKSISISEESGLMKVYAEVTTLVGWENEGIRIIIPMEIYHKVFSKGPRSITMRPTSMEIEGA